MNSPSSEELLQERYNMLVTNIAALSAIKIPDEEDPQPFKDIVEQIMKGTPTSVQCVAKQFFVFSKTWKNAKYMKFTFWNWWKNRKKRLGLLIKD